MKFSLVINTKQSSNGGLFWPFPKVLSLWPLESAAEVKGRINWPNTKFANSIKQNAYN